ncbi:hypothetical protein [Citricoccus sp. I39-566]|uniref:hypothetical protein n=1 Tax=Citricoccus sp. I39-566 TaxID=3073268 RepID=UPI00286A7D25|nr:hypothetical protein [Citricoccus sp. I39-566]WMY80004.1 hypothetical protein RE421_16055 [Citricoccus sp. I39-566]
MPAEPPSSSSSSEQQPSERQWPLWVVVAFGFLASCLALGLAIWYFAYQATLGKAPEWWWFPALSQDEMFAVIRNAVTAVAALGVGVTLFLSYRRQHVAERTLQLSAQAQRQAADTLNLSAKTYDLTQKQHAAEYQNQLRNRYSTAAQQIGEDNTSLVIAGCISMATVADEWHRLERPADRNDCIRMLIAALPEGSWADKDVQLKRTTIQAIFQERMSGSTAERANWSDARLDFGTSPATFGKIVGWNILGTTKIGSKQLALGSESSVIQSTRVASGVLEVAVDRFDGAAEDFDRNFDPLVDLRFEMLDLINAHLLVEFPFSPPETRPSKVVFRNSSFQDSTICFDEPNTPGLSRHFVFDGCAFQGSRIRIPQEGSNYRFSFEGCTFESRPFFAGDSYGSSAVIELDDKNKFVGDLARLWATDANPLRDSTPAPAR